MADEFIDKTLQDAHDIQMGKLNPHGASYHALQTHQQLYGPAPGISFSAAFPSPPTYPTPNNRYSGPQVYASGVQSPAPAAQYAGNYARYNVDGPFGSFWRRTVVPLLHLCGISVVIYFEWLVAKAAYPRIADNAFNALEAAYASIAALIMRAAHVVQLGFVWLGHRFFDAAGTDDFISISNLVLPVLAIWIACKAVRPISKRANVSGLYVVTFFACTPLLVFGVFLLGVDIVALARFIFLAFSS